jgi:hypothetical protein
MLNRRMLLGALGLLGCTIAFALPQAAIASERVIMKYNVFERNGEAIARHQSLFTNVQAKSC